MRNTASYLFITIIATHALCNSTFADNAFEKSEEVFVYDKPEPTPTAPTKPERPFTAFTGKASKNKVRLRMQPTLDAPILREVNKGDLFVVVGETDDFYAIEAPSDVKGYVFRTYILDNAVEGSRVNVRLEPSTDAPIIAQLHTGDRVDGTISQANNKWLEITAPSSTRFYISKDFIENIGNAHLKLTLEAKSAEGERLLQSSIAIAQTELAKTWGEIQLEGVNNNLNRLVSSYTEFPSLQTRAKEALSNIESAYKQKKMDYLESLAKNVDYINEQNKKLAAKLNDEQSIISSNVNQEQAAPSIVNKTSSIDRMNSWLPVENTYYESWSEMHDNQPISSFYEAELQKATNLKGIVQSYDRVVRNRPGDYVLLDSSTRIPVAYLYSTRVDLQNYLGKEVTLKATSRNNNNFAYPAYFVLSAE